MAKRDEAAAVHGDQGEGMVPRRSIRNKDLRAGGLTDVRAWVRFPRVPRVPTNQNEAPPRKRQLNLYLTNDEDTRRTAKAAAMLVDRSAANREVIEAVVTALERSAPDTDGNAPAKPVQTLRPETLKAIAEDQAFASHVNRLAAMPTSRRAEALALVSRITRDDPANVTGLRSRLRLAWRLIGGA